MLTIQEKKIIFEFCIETELRRKFTSEWANVLNATRIPNGQIDIQVLLLIDENCIERLLGMLDLMEFLFACPFGLYIWMWHVHVSWMQPYFYPVVNGNFSRGTDAKGCIQSFIWDAAINGSTC